MGQNWVTTRGIVKSPSFLVFLYIKDEIRKKMLIKKTKKQLSQSS